MAYKHFIDQGYIARDLKYLTDTDCEQLDQAIARVALDLNKIIKTLSSRS